MKNLCKELRKIGWYLEYNELTNTYSACLDYPFVEFPNIGKEENLYESIKAIKIPLYTDLLEENIKKGKPFGKAMDEAIKYRMTLSGIKEDAARIMGDLE